MHMTSAYVHSACVYLFECIGECVIAKRHDNCDSKHDTCIYMYICIYIYIFIYLSTFESMHCSIFELAHRNV